MSGAFRPEVSSRPEVSTRFRPEVSFRLRSQMSSDLWPEINSVSPVKETFQQRCGATLGRQAVLWARARRAHSWAAVPL